MDFSQQLIQDYLLSHVQTAEKAKWTIHVHPNSYEILLFKKGNVDYYINNQFSHLRPGDLLLIPPNLIHGFCVKDDSLYERLPVHIAADYAASLCTEQTDLIACFSDGSPRFLRLTQEQILLFETYVDSAISYLEKNDFGKDLFARSAISLLLLLVNSAAESVSVTINETFPEIIQHTLAYIDEHYTEDLSVSEIAEQMNLSVSRLCHVFKDFMGISLWNYVITRRIQKAQSLLKSGVSITATCYECGFQDYSHFIRSFSKIVGTPPKKYIQGILMRRDISPS